MTPETFIAKWQANTRNERAACQEHFIDLCHLLDEPTPNTDPTGARYAFEKGVTKATGGDGWADVWRAERFAWEYKGRHKDLEAAHTQLLRYAGALGNPPLLVTSDMQRFVIRTNWTNAITQRTEIALPDLIDPAKRHILKSVFANPDFLRPQKTRAALTAEAASEFADLARRLRARGHDAHEVAHFVIRLVFCLFADDTALLPAGLFERMLAAARRNPAGFAGYAARLFRAMADRGGEIDFTPIAWFNGGLFNDDSTLPLDAADIASLQRAAALDWAEIDPSLMGTLFERGLDPDKRSQLGAHYTDRDKIERLIDPVIRRPLLAEWTAAKSTIAAAQARAADPAQTRLARTRAAAEATRTYRAFLDRLRAFRVLDPACGSGNFLYLALLALKDLEMQAAVEAEALGLPPEFPQVGPEAVLGIELNPYAAELARVSVWIGHIQWARRHGLPPPADPILKPLDTIECRDAILAQDGTQATWPNADAIVGNPAFLGDKAMLGSLGLDYVRRLRAAYEGAVPGGADLVCYWFEKARAQIAAGASQRAGLVATNSIRGGANRYVLDRIAADAPIFEAWSDEPWTLDGAAVRVSLVAFGASGTATIRLNGGDVAAIFADLTAGVSDLTTARPLRENAGVAFNGIQKTGPFEVSGDVARAWLKLPSNPNGRPNADVVRPWWNGLDVTGRNRDKWIVDFGLDQDEAAIAFYAVPYAHLAKTVKPTRVGKREERTNRCWWLFQWSRPVMRKALSSLSLCIATPETPTHTVFVQIPTSVTPDKNLIVFAKCDDTTLGILHSRFHVAWVRALGSPYGNHPTARRYNISRTFETFPFPEGLAPDRPATDYADDPRAQAIATAAADLVAKRNLWLNPPPTSSRSCPK